MLELDSLSLYFERVSQHNSYLLGLTVYPLIAFFNRKPKDNQD